MTLGIHTRPRPLKRITRCCLSLTLPATHYFLHTGMEGALANADSAATSEVVALCQNQGTGLYERSALRRWDGGSVRKGNRLELSPLAKTRESAWLPGMLSREKIRAHSPGSYPDRFD
jgi:hypothetical protein